MQLPCLLLQERYPDLKAEREAFDKEQRSKEKAQIQVRGEALGAVVWGWAMLCGLWVVVFGVWGECRYVCVCVCWSRLDGGRSKRQQEQSVGLAVGQQGA